VFNFSPAVPFGSSLDPAPSEGVHNEGNGEALVRTEPPVRAWITVSFALALLVVVVIALVSYESTTDLLDTEARVTHTYEMLATLESIASSAAIAQGGVRGYALTGDERFLTSYQLSTQEALAGIRQLRNLTGDNPEQRQRADRLTPLIERLAAWMGDTVTTRRDRGLESVMARVRAYEGEVLAESLRRALDEIEAVERALLVRRSSATSRTASRTLWIIQIGGAVGFVIVLAASVVISRDVERRRRMDRVLAASERRYRGLFERNLAGIVRVRLDGRILDCNPAYVRMLGYESRADVLRLNARDLYLDPEGRERLLAGLRTPTGRMDVEIQLRRADGKPIWVSATVMETFDGEHSGYEALVIDVTERKQAKDQVQALHEALERRVADLDAANRELDAFSYSISHDLRAPLRAMQGFAETLLEDYGPRLDAAGQDYARRIVAASRRMDELILDLLAFSRLSRSEVRLEPLSVETALDDICAALEPEIKARQAEIVVERPLPRVMGHLPVLDQIFINLLTNALKFVAPDTTPRIRIWSEEGASDMARIWVEDNGIGIAPDHQQRIFRPFERLHGGSKYPGTGIGLAIVLKAVERLGGRVGVESRPGSGSRFWVDLTRVESV
jgi:PAS domain S-box-containing protein